MPTLQTHLILSTTITGLLAPSLPLALFASVGLPNNAFCALPRVLIA